MCKKVNGLVNMTETYKVYTSTVSIHTLIHARTHTESEVRISN